MGQRSSQSSLPQALRLKVEERGESGRETKTISLRKTLKLKESEEGLISLKLKVKGTSNTELILKEQMSQLHLCRFVFRVV